MLRRGALLLVSDEGLQGRELGPPPSFCPAGGGEGERKAGRQEGRKKGREEGRKAGREEGKKGGREEGKPEKGGGTPKGGRHAAMCVERCERQGLPGRPSCRGAAVAQLRPGLGYYGQFS